MKNIIYAFLFLALPISMAGKDSTTTKADSALAAQAAKQEGRKNPPAPSIVKHDTVYVAIQEESYSLIVDIMASFFTLVAIVASIWYSNRAIKSSRKATDISEATLKEMERQRLAAYKPELILISDKEFTIKILFSRPKPNLFKYNIESNISYKPTEDTHLKLLNLGGIAKQISIDYNFNLEPKINELRLGSKIQNNRITIEDKDFPYTINAGINEGNIKCIEYMLPTIKNDSIYETIHLPYDFYLVLIEATKHVRKPDDFNYLFNYAIVPITYKLKYSDIHGKEYTKNILVECGPAIYSSDIPEKEFAEVLFKLQISEKKDRQDL